MVLTSWVAFRTYKWVPPRLLDEWLSHYKNSGRTSAKARPSRTSLHRHSMGDSSSRPLRGALLLEGLHALLLVLRREDDREEGLFVPQTLVEGHVRGGLYGRLREPHRHRRLPGDLLPQFHRASLKLGVRHHRVQEPDPKRLRRGDSVPGQDEFHPL